MTALALSHGMADLAPPTFDDARAVALALAGMPVTILMFFFPPEYLDTWKESRSLKSFGATQMAFDGPVVLPGVDEGMGDDADEEALAE